MDMPKSQPALLLKMDVRHGHFSNIALSTWLLNGLDDFKVARYVFPDHTDHAIQSDHSY